MDSECAFRLADLLVVRFAIVVHVDVYEFARVHFVRETRDFVFLEQRKAKTHVCALVLEMNLLVLLFGRWEHAQTNALQSRQLVGRTLSRAFAAAGRLAARTA